MFCVGLTFEWYGDAMVFCVFIFIFFFFRSNVRKGYLNESDLRRCYGNFIESAIPKVA